MKETGKVWLIGAGPSDGGLFTIKGRDVLARADVVVYDRLVGQAVLAYAPADAEFIDVGKKAGHHTIPQEQINQILYEHAAAGRNVVRLKGGDPFLFGRGGEELELLEERGIPYEVIPGITSAVAVPAYQGIPVTHRKYASSVHIITGHKKRGEELEIDFDALYRAGGTCIFLMGRTALPFICEGFLTAGMRADMPAAVLEKGTTAAQRKIVATISDLPELAAAQRITSPAIIMIGEVCSFSEQFDWYAKLPLAGCRVVVTRPAAAGSRLSDKLREKGAEVLELPAIETVPLIPDQNFAACMEQPDQYDWFVFTSPAGVRIYMEALQELKVDIRRLAGIRFAVTGPGTSRELEQRGIYPELMPDVYNGRELGRRLAEQCGAGARILILRAESGSEELTDELQNKQTLHVTDVPIYRTIHKVPGNIKRSALEGRNDYYAVFTSASTVTGFAEGTRGMNTNPIKSICIGRQTEEKALQYGLDTEVSAQASLDSLVETLTTIYQKN